MDQEEDTLTLLFPDSSHVPVSIQDISATANVAVTDITISDLANYIFHNHVHDQTLLKVWSQGVAPEKPTQLRLIHMGRPLNGQTKLSEMRLELSKVIHVSVRPLEAEDKHHQGEKSGGCCIIA